MAERPIYESSADREQEELVMNQFCPQFDRNWYRLPRLSASDFFLADGNNVVTAIGEVKCRAADMATLDGYGGGKGFMLSKHKWNDNETLSKLLHLPFLLIVRAAGVLWFHSTKTFEYDSEGYGGRVDRGDPKDIETLVYLRASRFRTLAS